MENKVDEKKFGMLDKFGMIFSDPKNFFKKIKSEKNVGNSLLMYVLVSIVVGVGSFFSYSIIMPRANMFFGIFAGFTFSFFILGAILTFVYSGIIHLLLSFTKKDIHYVDTYNVLTYSLVPAIAFSIIPFGSIAIIYSLVLTIIGISEVHGVSNGRASFVVLMPIFIFVSFLILIAFSFIMMFGLF